MNPLRLVVFAVALVAGGIAAYLAASPGQGPATTQFAPVAPAAEVLVAATDIPVGATVSAREVKWQAWPGDGVGPGMITRASQPNAVQDFTGALARTTLMTGEPIRNERLVKANQGGVMSALLPAGQRALAITIDNRGSNSAGNFILPNDRVDVIRIFKNDDASHAEQREVYASETLLRNVKVLAIGQNIQERNGEKVVVGETATLELDPGQVELVLLAQRVGQLSLALRSLQDIAKADEPVKRPDDNSLTIVRYGAATQR
ncbi:Flp pilus assembly protein CpaB [Alsobacter sp. SYSU M60028]|uniref:Flp pilus assembly protein CpaB n=1 Tax=Alsobacter ponti TaxID=2962936 RepID=A0ABT1L9H0_9HYPH|nr:Flp pilus assembly protein CpaB [Alsobacter ponti]MCP8938137.1 Flp pilus assembly protein CpaB [Alsobacter ponti]